VYFCEQTGLLFNITTRF